MCLFLDSIVFVYMSFLAIQHSLDYRSSTAGFEILWNKLFNFIILFQELFDYSRFFAFDLVSCI